MYVYNNKNMKLLLYFKETYWRWDTDQIINSLQLNHNVTVVRSYDDAFICIPNIDCLIITSEASNIIPMIHDKYPDFFSSKKLIIIRTITSWDIFHFVAKQPIYLSNIYMTLNHMVLDVNNNLILPYYTRKENINFVQNLLAYKNIERLPLLKHSTTLRNSKYEFYKKYNLDESKGIITIYLSFPKNFNEDNELMNATIETYIINNPFLLDSLVTELGKKYNVVFKPHPVFKMKFNPFIPGDYWYKSCVQRTAVSLDTMMPIIEKYTFISMYDGHDLNLLTDMGVILSRSTFGFNNYMFNIPLLYVSNNDNVLQKQYNIDLVDRCYLDDVCYGEFTTIEELETNMFTVVDNFIDKFKDKPPFEHKSENILYGNTYEHDPNMWVDYIERVINKPIK